MTTNRVSVWFVDQAARDAMPGVRDEGVQSWIVPKAFERKLIYLVDEARLGEFAARAESFPGVVHVFPEERGPMQVHVLETIPVTLTRAPRAAPLSLMQYMLYQETQPYLDWQDAEGEKSFTRDSDRLGAQIYFAIVDTGVDATHPEFVGTTVTRVSDQQLDGSGVHGTAVASICAGAECGFCPGAKILDVKVFTETGGGFPSAVEDGLDDLVAWGDANLTADDHMIIVMSAGYTSGSNNNPYSDEVAEIESRGWSFWASAGNSGLNMDSPTYGVFPANELPYTGIGAVFHDGTRTAFSNWSDTINLYAPGYAVPAARAGGGYWHLHGTSFSAPVAAAAYGTWLSPKYPAANAAHLVEYLSRYHDFCWSAAVRERGYLEGDERGKAIARADNLTPIQTSVTGGALAGVALDYGASPAFRTVHSLEAIILYD